MNNNTMNELLEKAQQMKSDIEKIKEDLGDNLKVVGESGGGLVKITMNGRYEVLNIEIEDSLLSEKKEVIEDLFAGAFNDSANKIRQRSQERLSDLTKNLNLPGDMKMPF